MLMFCRISSCWSLQHQLIIHITIINNNSLLHSDKISERPILFISTTFFQKTYIDSQKINRFIMSLLRIWVMSRKFGLWTYKIFVNISTNESKEIQIYDRKQNQTDTYFTPGVSVGGLVIIKSLTWPNDGCIISNLSFNASWKVILPVIAFAVLQYPNYKIPNQNNSVFLLTNWQLPCLCCKTLPVRLCPLPE